VIRTLSTMGTLCLLAGAVGCGDRDEKRPQKPRNAIERRLRAVPTPDIKRTAERLSTSLDEIRNPWVFRWPLDNIDVTSPYGIRMHPVVRRLLYHAGVDFRAPRGEPVLSSGPGHVTKAGWMPLTGKTVVVEHPGQLITLYAHLDELLVFEGQQVDCGAPVGLIGSTGRSTGPHLHFGAYRKVGADRHPIDPGDLVGTVIDPRHPPDIPLPPRPQKKKKPR
jgi:murein DD-endopeptidase MepM/ murein hydrolase activator NlpD